MGQQAAALSPTTRLRWHLAKAYLLESVGESTDWRWPDEVQGVLGRQCRALRQRGVALERGVIDRLIATVRKNQEGGGEAAAIALIEQLESVLTFHPTALLKYLHHAPPSLRATTLLHLALARLPEAEDVAALEAALLKRRPASISTSASSPQKRPAFLTAGQGRVFDQLYAIGELFFEGDTADLTVSPRYNPLVSGPTGVGKTYVAAQAAQALGAFVLRRTFGDWVPVGASTEYCPSIVSVVDTVLAHNRVALILEELDRWVDDPSSSWARSCLADLFQLVDKAPALDSYLRLTKRAEAPSLGEQGIRQLLKRRLWVCGIGTWQSIHTRTALGFASGGVRRAEDLQHEIQHSRTIPDELRLRFNPDVLLLSYPTPTETAAILRDCGLAALATEVGEPIDVAAYDWSRGGMRTLEDLATQLLLRRRQLRRAMAATPTPAPQLSAVA